MNLFLTSSCIPVMLDCRSTGPAVLFVAVPSIMPSMFAYLIWSNCSSYICHDLPLSPRVQMQLWYHISVFGLLQQALQKISHHLIIWYLLILKLCHLFLLLCCVFIKNMERPWCKHTALHWNFCVLIAIILIKYTCFFI